MKLLRTLRRITKPLPRRLVLDISLAWAGLPPENLLTVQDFQDLILDFRLWRGRSEVAFLSRGGLVNPDLPQLVRFASRLEHKATWFGQGESVDQALAEQLAGAGLDEAVVIIGAVTPSIHEQLTGKSLGSATDAVLAFLEARDSLGAKLKVSVEFPCAISSAGDMDAVEGWARQVGADHFRVVQPLYADNESAPLPEELRKKVRKKERSRDPFHTTRRGAGRAVAASWASGDGKPGALRSHRCLVHEHRIGVTACGAFGACPHKAPLGFVDRGEISEQWGSLDFSGITGCSRSCAHPGLLK